MVEPQTMGARAGTGAGSRLFIPCGRSLARKFCRGAALPCILPPRTRVPSRRHTVRTHGVLTIQHRTLSLSPGAGMRAQPSPAAAADVRAGAEPLTTEVEMALKKLKLDEKTLDVE